MDDSPPGSSVHGLSRLEYWKELPCPSPGDLPNPGIKPESAALQADSPLSEPPGKPLLLSSNQKKCLYAMFLSPYIYFNLHVPLYLKLVSCRQHARDLFLLLLLIFALRCN